MTTLVLVCDGVEVTVTDAVRTPLPSCWRGRIDGLDVIVETFGNKLMPVAGTDKEPAPITTFDDWRVVS